MQADPYFFDDPRNIPWLTAGAASATLWMLGSAFRSLSRTTLVAPLVWGAIAAGAALATAWSDGGFVPYSVAVLFIAPTLAVLGAKRPQNGAWQFIVVTLVGVLWMPVLQGWAYGDTTPHVHMIFRWLLAAHILLGALNYLATRYAGPALVFAAAQVAIAWNYLPGLPQDEFIRSVMVGSIGLAIAVAWAWLADKPAAEKPSGLQRLWLDFRDAYGAVWALRVAERLNAAAKLHGWPVEFTWSGILVTDGTNDAAALNTRPSEAALDALDPAVRHRVERELRSMLRRFVSHEWIVARLEPGAKSLETSRPTP